MKKIILCFCLAIAGCGNQLEQKIDLNCTRIKDVDILLTKDRPQMVVFGEIHGTHEVPAFIGDVVCRSLELGYPTILALEFSESLKPDINNYWENPNETIAKDELLKTSYWYSRGQDGKTSKAMFQLLQRSKNYKMDGYNIKLVLFDVPHEFVDKFQGRSPTELGRAREIKMAENLQKTLNDYPERKIIVLTGNYHSPLLTHNNNEKFSMTSHLPRDKFITLNINSQSGTAWIWPTGVTRMRGRVHAAFLDDGKPSAKRAVHIFDKVTKGYDGLYYTVSKTTSEPTNQ